MKFIKKLWRKIKGEELPQDIIFNKYGEVVHSNIIDLALVALLFAVMFLLPQALLSIGVRPGTIGYTIAYLFGFFGTIGIVFGGTEVKALLETRGAFYIRAVIRAHTFNPVRTQMKIKHVWELQKLKDKDGNKVGETTLVFVRKRPISPYEQISDEKQLVIDEAEVRTKEHHYYMIETAEDIRFVAVLPDTWHKTFQFHKGHVTIADTDTIALVTDCVLEFRGRTTFVDYIEKTNDEGKTEDIEKIREIIDIFEVVDSDWHFLNRQLEFMKKDDVEEVEKTLQYNIAMKYVDQIEELSETVMHLSETLNERDMDFNAHAAEISKQEMEKQQTMMAGALGPLAKRTLMERLGDVFLGGAIVFVVLMILIRNGVL